jgi:hypothetical protein
LKGDAEVPLPRWIDLLNYESEGTDAVIGALKRHPERLKQTPDLRDALHKRLQTLQDESTWFKLFALLRELMPERTELYYEARRLQPDATWPVPIDTLFISLADHKHDGWLADLKLPASATDCDGIRWRLAVLERRAEVKRPIAKQLHELWADAGKCMVDHEHAGLSNTELWDRVVEAALKNHESLDGLALPLPVNGSNRSEPAVRSKKIAQLHESTLAEALANDRSQQAQYLLRLGVAVDGRKLTELGYWNRMYGSNSNSKTVSITDLSALQRARAVPDFVWKRAQSIASDQSGDFDQRAWALVAVVRAHPNANTREWLVDFLLDQDANIGRIASTLLAESFAELPADAALPDIPRDVFETFLTRGDLPEGQSKAFHQRLLRFSNKYVELYIEIARENIPCQLLAGHLPASRSITRLLLINAAKAGQRASREQLLCIRLIGDSKDPSVVFANTSDQLSQDDAIVLDAAFRQLWEDEEIRAALEGNLAQRAANNAAMLSKSLESQERLEYWEQKLRPTYTQIADQIKSERNKRMLYAALIGVPLALLVHIAAWILILTLYPRYTAIQAIVLWNPWFRKVMGLGYFDIVLLAWPFARRQLFAPFREQLLGDVLQQSEGELDRRHYFQDSLVRLRNDGATEAEVSTRIVDTLPRIRGRVLLLGRSGLGKSSFLRYALTRTALQAREVAAYLRADQCKQGVEAAIVQRCMALGNDQQLVRAMIHSGRLFVFIDGYNEVDSATQDQITLFMSNFPRGNILVASQIQLRGLTRLQTFEIQPLGDEKGRDFLLSRINVLPPNSCVSGELYVRSASAFFDEYLSRRRQDVLSTALDEVMSNPMDLTTVALLLSQAKVPDLYSLEWQHFEVAQQRLAMNGATFRIEPFSKAVLEQRLTDREDLEKLEFKPEVVSLVECKLAQLRTYADRTGRIVAQETRFRHDRVRDFFCHFAMASLPPDEMSALARDTRLSGVFPFLARSLPGARAVELRERLIQMAAEVEDHRVSDAYVRELGRRQQMQIGDPEWLDRFDSSETRTAMDNVSRLLMQRSILERELSAARQNIDQARRFTQILTQADPDQLLIRVKEILETLGATTGDGGNPDILRTPRESRFALGTAASSLPVQAYQLELALARCSQARLPVLLVANGEAAYDPALRQPMNFDNLPPHVLLMATPDLLALIHSESSDAPDLFWQSLDARSQEGTA